LPPRCFVGICLVVIAYFPSLEFLSRFVGESCCKWLFLVGCGAGATVYRKDPRETTEWDDIQRKLGNLPPLPTEDKSKVEEAPEISAEEARLARLEATGTEELDDIDDDEFLDDRFLEEYKAKRIAEMKASRATEKFGEVLE
jgi:hypothetical protein